MTTFNTGNPLGSTDVYDRYDNSENLDNFSNGPLDAYVDRFGVSRQSLQGIRNASQYQVLGAYAAGLVFTSNNQVFSYLGEFYAPGPSIAFPYTTTGIGAAEIANFRTVGDAVLRGDLSSTSAGKGAAIISGAAKVVSSIASLKLLIKTSQSKHARVTGYYTQGDGGGGDYWYDSSDTTSPDNGGTIIVAADGGRWKLIVTDYISIRQFGAKGDGVDDSAAIDKFIAVWLSGRVDGYIPAGNYKHTGRIIIDVDLNPGNVCPRMYGDGPYSSTITSAWDGITPAIYLYKTTSGADVTAFQGKFDRIGFSGNTPFIFFQVGKDDLLDNHGNYLFDQCFWNNANTTSGVSAATVKLNWLFDCEFRNCVTVGKPMFGTSLWSVKQHFCKHTGGSYSNAANAVLFNGGPNFNVTFDTADFENVKFACYGDDASAEYIYFNNCYYDIFDPIALTYPSEAYPIYVGSSQAGGYVFNGCKFARPQSFLYAYSGYGTPGAISPFSAYSNFTVEGRYPGQVSKAIAASDTAVLNNTGQVQIVTVSGATSIFINAQEFFVGAGCFTLNPGDTIALRYSTAPIWSWRALK